METATNLQEAIGRVTSWRLDEMLEQHPEPTLPDKKDLVIRDGILSVDLRECTCAASGWNPRRGAPTNITAGWNRSSTLALPWNVAVTVSERNRLSEAWGRGAEISADIFGDVDASDCPYDDPELAAAWRDGTETLRDWDGKADLSANPYED